MKQIKYQDYQKLIQKQAWRWHKKVNIELDDAIAEGNLVFAECLPSFDPDKGQFSTMLYSTVENRFKNIIIKNGQRKNTHCSCVFIEELSYAKNDNPEKVCIFKSMLDMMSKEAKEIISIVLDTPKDLLDILPKPKLSIYQLTKYFVKKGYKKTTINKAINEIKFVINS